MAIAFLQTDNERRLLNLGGVVGRSETANSIATICDIFTTKPMFPFDLDIRGTWLIADVAARNSCGYRKSVTAGNPECLQKIESHSCLQELWSYFRIKANLHRNSRLVGMVIK